MDKKETREYLDELIEKVPARYISRAKAEHTGNWVYGSLFYNRGFYAIGECTNPFIWYRVDIKTVGQCTGLKDKDGDWIFEGDIVEMVVPKDYDKGLVEWNYSECCFIYRSLSNSQEGLTSVLGVGNQTEEMVTIGNKTDNPELLEPNA